MSKIKCTLPCSMYLKTSKMCVLYAVSMKGFWSLKEKIPETKIIGTVSLVGDSAYKVQDFENDVSIDNGSDWFNLAQRIEKNGTYLDNVIICIPEKYVKQQNFSEFVDEDDFGSSLSRLTLDNGEKISLHHYSMYTIDCSIPSSVLKR